jgi:hypothetical protein
LSSLGEDFLIDGLNCRHCRCINKAPVFQLRIAEIETNEGLKMDRLHSMRVFSRVIEQGSFAGAARDLNLSPAVVTAKTTSTGCATS